MVTAVNIAVIIVTALGALMAYSYVLTDQRRASKKPLYLWKGILLTYFVIVYLVAIWTDFYFIRSGLATRFGVMILTSLLVANVILDWRKK
jgi:hypothetical protein